MKIVLIGRTKLLRDVGLEALKRGHEVLAVVTAKESPESFDDAKLLRSFADDIPCKYFYSPNLKNLQKDFQDLGPIDIGLSVNYVSIIDDLSISNFRLGILNIHGGDLPRYRGNACQAWAILQGEEEVGLCIHKMVGGQVDSGDIIGRQFLAINDQTNVGDILQWINQIAPTMTIDAAEALAKNPSYILQIQSQDPSESLRTYSRRPEDAKINWGLSATDICRLIRASTYPYSGAYSYLDDALIRIWNAHPVKYPPILSIPGQIVGISTEGFDVSVEDGSSVVRVVHATINGDSNWSGKVKSTRQRLQ